MNLCQRVVYSCWECQEHSGERSSPSAFLTACSGQHREFSGLPPHKAENIWHRIRCAELRRVRKPCSMAKGRHRELLLLPATAISSLPAMGISDTRCRTTSRALTVCRSWKALQPLQYCLHFPRNSPAQEVHRTAY